MFLRETPQGVEIALLVQPRSSRTRLAGEHDGRLKLQLAAPPVDGAANEALIAFLSERLGVSKRQVVLLQGQTGRRKLVRVEGVALERVRELIERG